MEKNQCKIGSYKSNTFYFKTKECDKFINKNNKYKQKYTQNTVKLHKYDIDWVLKGTLSFLVKVAIRKYFNSEETAPPIFDATKGKLAASKVSLFSFLTTNGILSTKVLTHVQAYACYMYAVETKKVLNITSNWSSPKEWKKKRSQANKQIIQTYQTR